MEYIIVKYHELRKVYADGNNIGLTNETLIIREGEYTFNLGTPMDYEPTSRTVFVKGTNPVKKMIIEFKHKNP